MLTVHPLANMPFPNLSEMHGVLYEAWLSEPPGGVQK